MDTATVTGAPPRGGVPARIAIVWVCLTLAWVLVGVVRRTLLLPHLPYDATQAVQAVFACGLGVGIVVVACRLLDHRTLRSLGFGSLRTQWRALVAGAGFWLGFAAVGLGVGVAVGAFRLEVNAPSAAFAGWLVLQLGLVFCFEALPEELALRGYVYTNLAEAVPRWLAVLGQALLFMLWAFAFVGLQQAMGFGTSWSIGLERVVLFLTFGVVLALLRLWTGSLWGAIGFHWAFQVVTQLLAHDRLVVLRAPAAEDLLNAQFFLWLFPIAVGGVVALLGLRLSRRG